MTTPTATTQESGAKPVGREEVVDAVLRAAAELFADKGPDGTSIREIAARAGVNHGLVHRHFGSKRELLGATMQHLADQAADRRSAGASAAELLPAVDQHLRIMVRATLDGYPIEELQQRRPGMQLILDQVRPGHRTEREARLAAAHATALQLGWRLLGPAFRSGFGLEDMSDEELQSAVADEVQHIVTPR